MPTLKLKNSLQFLAYSFYNGRKQTWQIRYIRYAWQPNSQISKIHNYLFYYCFFVLLFVLFYLCISYPACPTVRIQYVPWRRVIYVLPMNTENKHRSSGSFWALLHEFLVVLCLILYHLWHTSENLASLCHLKDTSLHSFISTPQLLHPAFYYFEKNPKYLWCSVKLNLHPIPISPKENSIFVGK